MHTLSKQVAVLIAFAALLLGCGSAGGSTKAGSASSPVTLRIGTDDSPGRPSADQIEEFARQVKEQSGGTFTIEPVWHAAGTDIDDWDQAVGRMVENGTLDMGLIPARSWDTEGVTSMRALHAPFLVTSDALVAKVVSSDLATDMLAGLQKIDLTDLALFPEGLRRLFAFGDGPAVSFDIAGKGVWAPNSATTYALLTALGARPVDTVGGDARRREIDNGDVVAAETEFALAGGLPTMSTAAANMVLYPKLNSLVINTKAFAALGEKQRQVLRTAAAGTREWAIHQMPSDAVGAMVFCKSGGRVVDAPADLVAAAVESAQTVYDTLDQDATTKALIGRIRAMKAETPAPSPIAPCEPAAAPPASGVSSSQPGTKVTEPPVTQGGFPQGVWRKEVTMEALLAAGIDRGTATAHAGAWEIAFHDGKVTVKDVNAASGKETVGQGVYCLANGRVTLGLLGFPPACGDFWNARWSIDADRLQFFDVKSDSGSDQLLRTIFGGSPFLKAE